MALKICIPLVPKTLQGLLEEMKIASQKADVIEIWLGELSEKERDLDALFALKNELNIPLLINIKDEKEKGHFTGTAEEKTNILIECAKRGAEYIDVDYEFSPPLLKKINAEKAGSQLILSAHFFRGTPSLPSLLNRIEKMKVRGADMVKIAAFPEEAKDLITILRLSENLNRSHIPFIAISMGNIGKPSRALTPILGGEMMFAPLDEKNASAPGQMTVEELREVYGKLSG